MSIAEAVHIGLIACSRSKVDRPAPARELYISPLFRAARAFAERRYGPGRWFILSARYGLVDPDQVLLPYDRSLHQLTACEREAWGDRVAVQLTDRFPAGTVLYGDVIARVVPHQVRFPLAGLRIGEQLAWYRLHALARDTGLRPDTNFPRVPREMNESIGLTDPLQLPCL